MFFQQVYEKSLAHFSYVIGCQMTGEAIVIDPKRDIDTYVEIAKAENLFIKYIAETHIHADYLSGSQELAHVTGAQLLLSDEGGADWQYDFPHIGLKDGDSFKVGNLVFDILHTPGHTPESISFLLTDTMASPEPVMIFTGDFVFVGDVGRPDLLEEAAGMIGTKEIGAKQLFESIEKFKALPDFVQVYPAHGAGSACGKSLGAVPSSTVGYEKIRNWALQYGEDEAGFTEFLLKDQPEAPFYFGNMKKLNKTKRSLLAGVPKLNQLTALEFEKVKDFGLKLIDTRSKQAFSEKHFPGSINIENSKSFNTWMGWMVNYEEQILLIANENEVEDLVRKLMRIGMDNIYGFITSEELFSSDLETSSISIIDRSQMEIYTKDSSVQIVDVRSKKEFEAGQVPNATSIFVGHLKNKWVELDPSKKTIVYCQSGTRSAIASSFLAAKGFNIENYSGGYQDWSSQNENKN